MPISSITTDYTGRLKDISILQYPNPYNSAQETSAWNSSQLESYPNIVAPSFGKITRFCSGVQKLIQKYAIILLTNIGSQDGFPSFGTNFLYSVQAGLSPVDNLRAAQLFTIASYKAVNTLVDYQISNPNTPSDERIVSAELVDVVLSSGVATFNVEITTEAGDTVPFLLPLPR
jgi:hypothetical protein